jgi:hypothetical protein
MTLGDQLDSESLENAPRLYTGSAEAIDQYAQENCIEVV